MKWVLLVSLALNGFLAWKLSEKKEIVREEIVEKVIVKKSAPEIIEKKIIVEKAGENPDGSATPPKEFDEAQMQDLVVDVNKDREDFLVGKLGFSENEFKKLESVKQHFYDRYQKILPPDQVGTLSLEQRKAILQLEEERDAEYARTLGPQKWKRWETFRDKYNQKMYKKALKDKGAIVPMEI